MGLWGGIQTSVRRAGHTAMRFVAERSPVPGPSGAAQMAGDSWRPMQASSARSVSAGFGESMKAVSQYINRNGRYSDASGPLMQALDASIVTGEALEVARFATRLSTLFHPDNAVVITPAFRRATELARSAPEALDVVREIVKTRQAAFALFPLGHRHDVLEGAVEKWATLDGRVGAELARDAFKLVKFSEFAKTSEKQAIRRIASMETPEQWVTSISNYLRKALD